MSNDIYLRATVLATLPSGKKHTVHEVYETADVSSHSIEVRLVGSVYTAAFNDIKAAYLEYLKDNAPELTAFIWPDHLTDEEKDRAEVDYYFGDGQIQPLDIKTKKDTYQLKAFEQFILDHSSEDGWELTWCFK